MTHYLPSHTSVQPEPPDQPGTEEKATMADLRVFWGPEICRIEYLVHLLDTGRVKDEYWPPRT